MQVVSEASYLYGKPLLNSCVNNSVTFAGARCNELILPLLQKLVHLLKLLFYFDFVQSLSTYRVSLHAVGIIGGASGKIFLVNDTGLKLVGPSFEVSDEMGVSFWFQEIRDVDWEW